MPISTETYGGIEGYAIRNKDSLLKHSGSTMERESQDFGWVFGTLLSSTDYTTNNIWWGRLAYQGESVTVFNYHFESLAEAERENYSPSSS